MRKNKVLEFSEKSSKTNYSYSAKNESFLDGLIIPYIVRPLLKIIPYQLPANIITIISNSCVFLAFIIASQALKGNYTLFFLYPILVLIYVIGDSTDGEQARRTKTGSPLGEFLDHFLDTFVTAELIISIYMAYGVTKAWVIYPGLYLAYITQATSFWERYKNGRMTFGKFSSTESIITLTAVATCGCSKTIRDFVSQKLISFDFVKKIIPNPCALFSDLSIIEFVLLMFAFFAMVNSIFTLIRTKGATFKFWMYVITSLIVTIVAVFANEDLHHIPCFTLSLLNINYISSLLSSIVMKEKDRHPDYFLAIFMTLMFILKIHNPVLTTFYFLYVVILVVIRASIFFAKNNKYWVWKNPIPENEA